MFKFFKEFDKDIYKEIVDEVEYNMWNDRCISIIQSEIEKIIKIIFKESDIVITNMGSDGIVYREYYPSLSKLFNEKKFKQYLDDNNILTYSDIDDYWKILNVRNDKVHGEKENKEKIKITLQVKKDSLKFLFKLCYNSYVYKFKNTPNAYWDDEYFKKLLTKPQEKIIKVEKVVKKVIEKEVKVIDNTELQKIKTEHENLKSQFEIIKNTATPSSSNIELLKKLEIANKCLEKKDFENAKLAYNNCRTLDVSCFDAYIGLILCDYHCQNVDELYKNIDNPLTQNENYRNILIFCSNEEKEKAIKLSRVIDYDEGVRLFNLGNYAESHKFFCTLGNDKLALSYINKIINIQKEALNKYLIEQDMNNIIKEIDYIDSFLDIETLDDSFIHSYNKAKEEKQYCLFIEFVNAHYRGCKGDTIYYKINGKEYSHTFAMWDYSSSKKNNFSLPEEYKYIKYLYFKDSIDINKIVWDDVKYNLELEKDREALLGFKLRAIDMFINKIRYDELSDLISVSFPENIKDLRLYVNLKQIRYLHLPDSLLFFHSERGIFYNLQHITLPPKCTVSYGAFQGCSKLKYVKISYNEDCSNIEDEKIPSRPILIRDLAFAECKLLKKIDIAEGCTSICWGAFRNCKKLEEIVLPSSLRKISYGAFLGCVNLKKVIFKDTEEWYDKEDKKMNFRNENENARMFYENRDFGNFGYIQIDKLFLHKNYYLYFNKKE